MAGLDGKIDIEIKAEVDSEKTANVEADIEIHVNDNIEQVSTVWVSALVSMATVAGGGSSHGSGSQGEDGGSGELHVCGWGLKELMVLSE